MHLSVHYSFGVIIACLTNIFIEMTPLIFGIIIFSSIIADLDFTLSKFAPDKNHRMLFTHSVYPSIILIIIGIIISKIWLISCGIAYFFHIFFDLFDWGVNFLMSGRIIGKRFLLDFAERDKVPELLKSEIVPKWFFVRRYYKSRRIIFIEIFSLVLMILSVVIFARIFWFYIFGYFLMISLHILEYGLLKRIIKKRKKKIY